MGNTLSPDGNHMAIAQETNNTVSSDNNTTIAFLKKRMEAFVRERDWKQFHTLKNLSMAISIEAAELIELLLRQTDTNTDSILEKKRAAIEHEVADIALYLLSFCSAADIDLSKAILKKMVLNIHKYPVEKSKEILMSDNDTTVELLKKHMEAFVQERNWKQFHTLKNLSMAISIETAELMELFLWQTDADMDSILKKKRTAIEHEVADIALYLLSFCSVAHIDLSKAIEEKMALNAQKYPISKSKGKADKYTEL
jgi:dCTP diphosphatase